MGDSLRKLEPGEDVLQWDRWRNQPIPLPFTHEEATATAWRVFGLPIVRTQTVEMVPGSPAGLDERARFLISLEDDPSIESEADDWASLVAHLLTNTSSTPWGLGRRLREIVASLRRAPSRPDITGWARRRCASA